MELNDLIQRLTKQTDSLVNSMLKEVESNVQPPPPENNFEPIQVLQKKASEAIQNDLSAVQTNLQMGFKVIVESLSKDPLQYEKLTTWFTTHIDDIQSSMAEGNKFEQTESLAQKLNFPEELLTTIYGITLGLMDEKQYEQAAAVSIVCLTIEPRVFSFWFTYGKILQLLQTDDAALYAFQMALTFDKCNPYVYAYMAKSWIALNMPEEANSCLLSALQYCEGNKDDDDLVHYCYSLQAYCNQQTLKK